MAAAPSVSIVSQLVSIESHIAYGIERDANPEPPQRGDRRRRTGRYVRCGRAGHGPRPDDHHADPERQLPDPNDRRRDRARSARERARPVGATEYGGPGDPSSGTVGARGDNLLEHPDTYAELGGLTWQTATRLGGLPYMTPLRITWGNHSAIAYKRDFGFGGRSDRRSPARHRPVVGVRRAPGHPVRERAVVGPGADRAAAQRRRGQRARAGRAR